MQRHAGDHEAKDSSPKLPFFARNSCRQMSFDIELSQIE